MDPWARLHLIHRVLEAAPLLTFGTAWVRRQHIPYALRPVYYYVGAEALLWFIDRISRITIHNNIYLYHLATVLMVFFLTQTYRRLLPLGRMQTVISLSLSLFFIVAVLDAAWLGGLFTNVNRYSHTFGSAILISLAMIHVARLTVQSPLVSLERQPDFFLSIAVLAYCSCSLITYIGTYIAYHSGYDLATRLRLNTLVNVPDTFLFAIAMALLAWMFSFFPLSTNPRRALPRWLHYSSWQQRPFRFLYQPPSQLAGSPGAHPPRAIAK